MPAGPVLSPLGISPPLIILQIYYNEPWFNKILMNYGSFVNSLPAWEIKYLLSLLIIVK
jgi:hypothetical protein